MEGYIFLASCLPIRDLLSAWLYRGLWINTIR